MTVAELFKQYLEHLFAGKRCQARELIFAAHDRGVTASKLLVKIIWPAMEQVDKLYRKDRITTAMEHMATRINRMLADQLQAVLARAQKHGRRIVVLSGSGQIPELCGQITADLFEGAGWSVWFLGAGVANDEILQLVGKLTPDILCICGANPREAPVIRNLIELIREVGVCEGMQVLVVGGVFSRADGLAEEVKADLYAPDIAAAIKTVEEHPVRIPKPDVPEPGRRRKRKKTSKSQAATVKKMRAGRRTAKKK